MSATCHLFEKRWQESVITVVAVSRAACHHRLHFLISRKMHNFEHSFIRPSCIAAFRILLYTNTHHQMGQQEEPVVDTCSPRRQAIYMSQSRTRVVRKVSVFCFCVILCGILCCPILFVILTLWTPEACIPAARYINATARSRYTGGTVINATG